MMTPSSCLASRCDCPIDQRKICGDGSHEDSDGIQTVILLEVVHACEPAAYKIIAITACQLKAPAIAFFCVFGVPQS